MIAFAEFIRQTEKRKPVQDYRFDDIVGQCMKFQKPDSSLPYKEMRNLVYSGLSLSETRQSYDEYEYLSEAHFKTFPVNVFIRQIAKIISKIFDIPVSVISKDSLKPDFICDENGNNVSSIQSNHTALVRVFMKNVENDIADIVDFELYLDKSLDKVNSFMENIVRTGMTCGYDYVSHNKNTAHENYIVYSIIFEARHSNSRIFSDKPLYHVAPFSLKEKILRFGLVPRSNSFNSGTKINHPERVYLFNKLLTDEQFRQFMISSGKKSNIYSDGRIRKEDRFALFEINIQNFNEIKLFRDGMLTDRNPDDPIAVYTYQNIPSSIIKFVKEI